MASDLKWRLTLDGVLKQDGVEIKMALKFLAIEMG